MPSRHRSAALLFVLAGLTFGLAGCGDDEDDSATPTTAASGDEGGGAGTDENTASIEMKDYAYSVEGELTAGTTTVELKNSGEEFHMAAFGLLKAGKSLTDVQAALQSEDENAFAGVFEKELGAPGGILSPGKTASVTTPFLEAGTYALICFIPTAGNPGDEGVGAPHFVNGMVNTLEVAAGDATVEAAEPDASYTVEDGKIDGPTELEAGETSISMTSAGEGPHEFIVVRRKDPATKFEDIDQAFTDLFEGETPPPKGYVDDFPAEILGSVFDVEAGNTVSLTVDLEPGSYLIGCAYAPDEEGAAAHQEFAEVTVT